MNCGLSDSGRPGAARSGETSRRPDCKRLTSIRRVEVAVVLALVDFPPRSPVVRALDRSALQMIAIRVSAVCPDCAVRWLDSERLEVPANPLPRVVVRPEK
jgi:hypothetical protein